MPTTAALPAREWRARARAHEARVEPWLAPRLARRAAGERHPVDDFLFEYYPYRPGRLRQWHPGHGVVLADAEDYLAHAGYVAVEGGVTVSDDVVTRRARHLRETRALLAATLARDPAFDCFGRHEWAMVYRLPAEQVRHASWPLRCTPAEVAAVVEAQPLRCTHYDAFRFFTEPARPLNAVTPTRQTAPSLEQAGCLHAGMDLYKWAVRLTPLLPAELVADCFALARELRTWDMRAAPYDLAALGIEPLRIETPAGRAAFAAGQRLFADRSQALRRRLIEALDRLPLGTG